MRRSTAGLGSLLAVVLSCNEPAPATPPEAPAPEPPMELAPSSGCPTDPLDVEVAPGTRPEHRQVQHWVDAIGPELADQVLVSPEQIAALNARFSEVEGAWRDPFDPAVADLAAQQASLDERMGYLRERVDRGELVEGTKGSLAAAEAIVAAATHVDELRMVADESSLWCAPLDSGLYKVPVDPAFDRNRCASLHPGELIRVLRRTPDGAWSYVHSGHTTGWLHAPVLTPPMPAAHLRELRDGPALVPLDDDLRTDGGRRLRLGTKVPIVGRDGTQRRVLVPTAEGLVEDTVQLTTTASEGVLPLTRRNAWTLALAEQDTPYGWGGTGGNRDCSRLTRDVMASFGLELARHSAVQGELGSHNIDVSKMSEADKLRTLEQWSRRGLVLLYMPGHVMLYLGKDGDQYYAVSAISEYLEPCKGGPNTVNRIGRVAVTTLELGRGSQRTAYVERLAKLVVFGPPDAPPDAPSPEPG